MTHTPDPPIQRPVGPPPSIHLVTTTGPGTLRVQQWAVPTGWPPAWLLGVTALGLFLMAADYRRSRRRRAAAGGVPS
jgi:hypothetical protein